MPGHYVIVARVIAGLSAAEAIRATDAAATITLVSEESHDSTRVGLAYLLRGDIPENSSTSAIARTRALRMERIAARVDQVLPASHEVVLSRDSGCATIGCSLAWAATAVPPRSGRRSPGVVKLDSLDDTRLILKQTGRRRWPSWSAAASPALELVEGCTRAA